MQSAALIERDGNGDTLWVWCFPSVTADLRDLLLRKCRLQEEERPLYSFLYGQYKRLWFYILPAAVEGGSALRQVTHVCLVITAKDFNPEKYASLSRTLSWTYLRSGSPVDMLESYISALTKGACPSDNGTFLCADYDQRKAYLSGSVKEAVLQFGMESILLYTALMLKKRIVVYHPNPEAVLEFSRSLPALVWHRLDWSILHPYVHLIPEELEALRSCSGYIAGFHQSEVGNRSDLYDVFVNLEESVITVSPGAKEALTLGKLHKEIGQLMVRSAEDPDKSESQLIKELSGRSRELLAVLASCCPEGEERPSVSLELLKQKKLPPATQNFLTYLAASEQMLLT